MPKCPRRENETDAVERSQVMPAAFVRQFIPINDLDRINTEGECPRSGSGECRVLRRLRYPVTSLRLPPFVMEVWSAERSEAAVVLKRSHNGLARLGIPYHHRPVGRARNDTSPIWRERSTTTSYSVAFSPDGKRIVSGSEDQTVRVWDAETGEVVLGPLQSHSSPVYSVAFSPDGKRIKLCFAQPTKP